MASPGVSRAVRVAFVAIAVVAVAALGGLFGRRFFGASESALPRLADGRVEGCLACHAGTRGLGGAHDPAALGCAACHLGDVTARDADSAHRGMEILSGDLSTVFATCGRAECHVTESARVTRSLMARAPGILAVDRFAFDERPTPDDRPGGFPDLNGDKPPRSPAESHARKLCGSCHLSMRKSRPGDEGFFSRGGGCAACHLSPPDPAVSQGAARLHPDVSAAVSEKRCEGCHSRSGRVALSYRGVVELEPTDPRVTSHLPDGRPVGSAPPDVHGKKGLTCIDCHTERELMGDGKDHLHTSDATEIRCRDCHGPTWSTSEEPFDEDAERVADRLRNSWKRRNMPPLPGGVPIRTSRKTALWRTTVTKGGAAMALATTGESMSIPRAKEEPYHRLAGHARLSCQACHSQWAPRCTTCHTRFDPAGEDVDHLLGVATKGHWIETAGGNGFGPPVLAVGPRGTIDPFVEGMTFTLEGVADWHAQAGRPRAAPTIEKTLWAPLDPHTTGPSRTCASCHLEGTLDAVYPKTGGTTRVAARLLDADEKARIGRVGRCIGCHPGYGDRVYSDFGDSLKRLREKAVPKCGGDPG
ncbi:MAG: hypothetical protein U0441_03840 [Polyangiaceae bacterium]